MLFTTFHFALFFVAVLALMRLVGNRTPTGNAVLLAASLVFYTLWIPAYLPLLLLDIGVNYALVRGIVASERGSRRRRVLLALSVTFTIGLLFFFKYAAFAVASALPVFEQLSLAMPVPEILLPLGISFYSFQIVSLSIDTYRDEGPPIPGLARYALYVSFFPQLIAGPILRGRDLLPQLAVGARPNADRTRRGLWLLASGVGKKVIFADFLLAPFADEVFGAPGVGNARFHWIGLYAFAYQIYFDFSGYTDMARGIALLIGYEVPENFHEPYLSRSPQEFWRRWHITLSTWLRDYLYIPLGGSRGGVSRTRLNLLITMVLGGLWHGAAFTFVLWGVYHGTLLVTHRLLGPVLERLAPRTPGGQRAWRALCVVVTFHLVCLGWVLFRATDVGAALTYLSSLFVPGELPGWPRLATLAVAASAVLHLAERFLRTRSETLQAWFADRPARAFLEAAAFGVLLGAGILVSGAGGEFIYFQF